MKCFRKFFSITVSFVLLLNSLFAIPQDEFNLIDKSSYNDIFSQGDDYSVSDYDDLNEFDFEVSDEQEDWNATRRAIETDTFKEELPPADIVETPSAILIPEPKKPPPSLRLPTYGTALSVKGRKILGFEHTSKRYFYDQTSKARPMNSSSFQMNQEMQLKIKGKIGPKITVDVDYDDTKEDKRDISITYEGEDDEMVQSAAFGDVDLSLPSTEFVSYNKQLFGIRMDLKHKNTRAIFIGSRTKGTTKTKQFTGNRFFQVKDILDTQYVRRQYYDLTFDNTSRLPITPGSEIVYLDDSNNIAADGKIIINLTVDDLATGAASEYTGKFRLLSPGIDYTVDYNKGIITFNHSLSSQSVVAVDYEIANTGGIHLKNNSSAGSVDNAGTGKYKLIKTKNDQPVNFALESTELGYKRELKTYYSIGQTQIVRDDGKGNFHLKVQDGNRNDVGSSLTPSQTYPDDIEVDFERGFFRLKQPFGYSPIYNPTPSSKYIFRVEYSSRIRTYFLEPGLVLGSEIVVLDGRKLKKDKDYFIDYDSGFITFYNENLIGANSKLVVNYDVSPFGGAGTSALLGGRISHELTKNVSVGATILYETGTEGKTAPSVNNLAKSTLVYEADAQIKDLKILPKVTADMEFEIAQSKTNPNINGFAIVENMEGVKESDDVSIEAVDWRIASNPPTAVGPAEPNAVVWSTEEVTSKSINPSVEADEDDKQRVLKIEYDFTNSDEISIVYPYSLSGVDFSRKNMVEMVVYSNDAAGPLVNLHFGQVDESSDGTAGVNLTCQNGTTLVGVPKTEDTNCDGILQASEDIGWLYDVTLGATQYTKRFGSGNGIIDTQDLNANRILDAQDLTGGDFGYVNSTNFTDLTDSSTDKNQLNFSGWHTFYTSLSISEADKYKWSAIRQVKLSLKKPAGGATKGVIKIAKISAVGNSWEVGDVSTGSTLNLSGINNEDNPDYMPIFSASGDASQTFNDLYGSTEDLKQLTGSDKVTEQSLELIYSSAASPSDMKTQRRFSKPIDISQHKELRFLLHNPSGNEVTDQTVFYLRIGTDDNYQQIEVPINFSGWRLFKIAQKDTNGDKVADIWENESSYTDVTVTSQGTADFQQVGTLTAGIKTLNSAAHSGSIWVNEIHLAKPFILTGNARKAQADFKVDGWGSFGAKYRYMDRNFQTPVTVAAKQDKEEQSAYLNITKINWLPVTSNYNRTITVTPNPLDSQNNNLVNLTEKGVVDKRSGNVKVETNFKEMPKLTLEYLFEEQDFELLERKDDSKTYKAGIEYTLKKRRFYLPTKVNAEYAYSTNKTDYADGSAALTQGYYNLNENTHNVNLKFEFSPVKDSIIEPTYSLNEVKEKRDGAAAQQQAYDKSMRQNAGFKGSFKILKWLRPSFDYLVNTLENNNLTQTTASLGSESNTFAIGEIKTINRTATGNFNLNINLAEVMPKSKLFKYFVIYSNYQLQDGDTWQNVEKDLDTKSLLWVRTALKPTGTFAQRTNLTIRDTYTSTQRWQPFYAYDMKEKLSPVKGLSISNNFTKSVQKTDVTGTESKTITNTLPDVIVMVPDIEKFFGVTNWVSDSKTNLKFAKRKSEVLSINESTELEYGVDTRFKLLNLIDTAFYYNVKDTDTFNIKANVFDAKNHTENMSIQGTFIFKKLTVTPKVDYSYIKTTSTGSILSEDTKVTTPGFIIRLDTNLPRGFIIPVVNRSVKFDNRITWTTNFSYKMQRSPVDIIKNSNTFLLNSDVDYEISKNLLLTLKSSIERLWHQYLKEEDFISYNFSTLLTLQF